MLGWVVCNGYMGCGVDLGDCLFLLVGYLDVVKFVWWIVDFSTFGFLWLLFVSA